MYDELFERVPDHPQMHRKNDPLRAEVTAQVQLLKGFVDPGDTVLEIGAGDCAVSLGIANDVKHVIAVDVSEQISSLDATPSNFRLVLSDGIDVPVAAESIAVAYSNQLMEHLHPDDAREQLEHVYRSLRQGGAYICITPNRLSGPHDVSGAFDSVATGFHLREYTTGELAELFRFVGFRGMRVLVQRGRFRILVPTPPVIAVERVLEVLPYPLRKAVAKRRPVAWLLGGIVGFK